MTMPQSSHTKSIMPYKKTTKTLGKLKNAIVSAPAVKKHQRIFISARDATILNRFQDVGFKKAGAIRSKRALFKTLSPEAMPIASTLQSYFSGK